MTFLLISLLLLAAGPLLYRLGHRAAWALPALDGFVLASVSALVLGYVLPQSVALGGPLVLLAALVGVTLPWLLERRSGVQERASGAGVESAGVESSGAAPTRAVTGGTARVFTGVAVLALALHALIDGVALGHEEASGSALGLAVLLHRASMGVAVWWLARPRFGVGGASALLIVVAAATLAGFAGAHSGLEALLSGGVFSAFQALVAGSLLHVLFHRATHVNDGALSVTRRRAIISVGAALGLFVAAVLPAVLDHSHDHEAHAAVDHD